jgi:hypothetical protein
MEYLWLSAIVGLVFGLLLLVSPSVLGALGSVFNSALFTLNGWTLRYRMWLGLVLLVIGAWVFYVGLQYPDPYIATTWIVAVVFGLLFLFLPGWLKWLSGAADAVFLSTDELVMGWRRVVGIVLVVASAYILYGIFYSIGK